MNTVLTPEIREVMETVLYHPAVSVFMAFEPKMSLKTVLVHSLEICARRVEKEILEKYPGEAGALVIQKLQVIFRDINFNTYKKSIAIFLSPVFEKVLYLDFVVEERIIIDKSFEIRDLVYCKKQSRQYLVLLMSGKASLMFVGNSSTLVRIVSNTAGLFYDSANEVQDSGVNFSDISKCKDISTDKFLHHIDNVLDIILNAYRLPLFVLAAEQIMARFKNLNRHAGAVIKYVPGNYEEVALTQLKKILEPHIADWKKVKQKDLLNQLEDAAGKKKLAVGMVDVFREAMKCKGRLLVVEKNYIYSSGNGSNDKIIFNAIKPYNKFSYIKNTVDEVMEKVLENGGDVEFAEEGLLKDYQQIALIQYC